MEKINISKSKILLTILVSFIGGLIAGISLSVILGISAKEHSHPPIVADEQIEEMVH